jgi:Uma2 family endonuclease
VRLRPGANRGRQGFAAPWRASLEEVALPVRQRFSFEDYLALEARSQVKHEYLDGQVWAMAGGTPDDGAVAANVIALLGNQLRGRPCRVFTSDVRIRVRATGLATYPVVSVVCGTQQSDPDDPKNNTLINPCVVVEVLSPSTEAYDRGEKLAHYWQIESLREVILIAYEENRIELWRREGARWIPQVFRGDESAPVPSLGCELPLRDVYRNPLDG